MARKLKGKGKNSYKKNKISNNRSIAYVSWFLFFVIVNIILWPHDSYAALGVIVNVDNDEIIIAYMLNWLLLLVLLSVWIYNIKKEFYKDVVLIILTLLNIIVIFYWHKYL